MEQEGQAPNPEVPSLEEASRPAVAPEPIPDAHDPIEIRAGRWVLLGGQGLRAGWSVLIFWILYRAFRAVLGTVVASFVPLVARGVFTPTVALLTELISLLAVFAAFAIVARIEQRRILDYNLAGPRPVAFFLQGLAAGFLALSALIGALAWGGWLRFGADALGGVEALKWGALWALGFLMVGCVEEGSFRCYLQFTLARSVNFWWASSAVAVVCADLMLRATGNGAWGVYAMALAGLPPCLILHLRKPRGSRFWQAAWVTSTLFGYIHTSNNGENWVGIFAAAAIGFVFCVSVRVTGSAWWAIGCHAAWDWAETYFYGAADSGIPAQGHFLTTSPAGNALWSGGTDGPEGSLLVLGVILLLLAALLAIYGRGKPAAAAVPATDFATG
jgi:hypothetical protein